VFNQKGGVGKTTTALNLLGALVQRGERPIGIDLDPQAHLSGILCGAPQHPEDSLFDFFMRNRALLSLLRPTNSPAEVIGAHIEMSRLDSLLGKSLNAITRLAAGLARRPHPERHVVIDCCPQMGVLSLNALFACDLLIVPVSADFLAMEGARAINHALSALEPVLKRRLPRRYLLTRFDVRRKMCGTIAGQLLAEFGAADVCVTHIAENVSLAESPWVRKDVFEHAPASRGAEHYRALLEELLRSGLMGTAMTRDETDHAVGVHGLPAPVGGR
ncbi:MAG: ParA family protein, partial [Betaproteobacteria bacterium]